LFSNFIGKRLVSNFLIHLEEQLNTLKSVLSKCLFSKNGYKLVRFFDIYLQFYSKTLILLNHILCSLSLLQVVQTKKIHSNFQTMLHDLNFVISKLENVSKHAFLRFWQSNSWKRVLKTILKKQAISTNQTFKDFFMSKYYGRKWSFSKLTASWSTHSNKTS